MIIFCSVSGWTYIVGKVKSINDSTDNLVKISETADKILTYVTKVTRVITGTTGVAKGTVDMLEAMACQDGVSTVVSGVGVCADGLSMAASFIPGPNVTTIVMVPVSVGCKLSYQESGKLAKPIKEPILVNSKNKFEVCFVGNNSYWAGTLLHFSGFDMLNV